ncbi:putative proline-rich receptor-like protein kinase PERK6 [Drosophila grimshawi]|uniref:GH12752 n=1 Tax=Drosophila grimshawi TaxID=7222 RepID=B4JKY0_DROGR|nr:putative proline-rich receptor-like protein kinase PERK6 [Drosophila grimshawi]EDW00233.1 GH12752 [Drosophila grimshawi]
MTPPPPLPPADATKPQQQQPPPPMGQTIAPTGAFPGSLTPGWNDPPPISSTDGTSNASNRRPRLDLRKRVAHPMNGNENGNGNEGNQSQNRQLPPPL